MSDASASTSDDKENAERIRTPPDRRLSHRTRRTIRKVGLGVGILVGLSIIIFPMYWMVHSSLLDSTYLYNQPPAYVPIPPTVENYEALFVTSKFMKFYANSITISAGVILTTTVISTLGGYGLARINIPLKRVFARSILFGYMFPPILLAIPMYIFWRQIGLLNSYVGAIFAITATSLPFSLWLMWQFFQTVPDSLEESAQMAGANRFRAFYEIALPLAKPGVIAVATFSYAVAWNAFTIPKIILPEQQFWPLTLGIENLVIANQILWPQVMAASALTILPAFLFVYFLQKYLLRGFRAGGVK